jgi:hypothetical protein
MRRRGAHHQASQYEGFGNDRVRYRSLLAFRPRLIQGYVDYIAGCLFERTDDIFLFYPCASAIHFAQHNINGADIGHDIRQHFTFAHLTDRKKVVKAGATHM